MTIPQTYRKYKLCFSVNVFHQIYEVNFFHDSSPDIYLTL